jgi:hypothetical protein
MFLQTEANLNVMGCSFSMEQGGVSRPVPSPFLEFAPEAA